MKKTLAVMFIIIGISCLINFEGVFCTENKINFTFNQQIYSYNIDKNIKTSKVFSLENEINKYDRFDSENRKSLLNKMLKLGFDKDITLNYLFPNLDNTIKSIEKSTNITAKDATLKIDTNSYNVFKIQKEVVGKVLNRNKLYDDLIEKIKFDKPLNIDIKIDYIQPEILEKDLRKFTHLRGDFSTNISSSSADRKHNIKNALCSLNKIEIYPNEVFSFNQKIGRRTEENGYREAKIIVNNEFVEGLGGGVCQVSTTLYNTALLSGLEIVEANKHSKQVSYVKYGFDAMVNFGSSDLKFRNNTHEKLTIITNYSSNNIRIRIYGEDMKNVKYKLRNEIISTTEPTDEIRYDDKLEYLDKVEFTDESFYLKKPSIGMEIKSFRDKYINNELIETEHLRFDKFAVQNGIKIYGVKNRPN